jgi:hypothetical protein
MAPTTNYSKDLGDREPLAAMRESAARLASLATGWTVEQFERPYAPGKWTARQVITHLAHTELALGVRARMALAAPNYTAQPFDQDAWMSRETRISGPEAVSAFVAVSRLNAALFEALSDADRQVAMSHPEYGTITVDWIIHPGSASRSSGGRRPRSTRGARPSSRGCRSASACGSIPRRAIAPAAACRAGACPWLRFVTSLRSRRGGCA